MLELKPERARLSDYQSHPVAMCGKALVVDMSGALWWPGEKALIVADLHLEKGSAFAARGQPLPPYDTRETLQKLAEAIDRYEPETIIALGDSLHDPAAVDRIDAQDRAILAMMQEGRRWIWVAGNHDDKAAGLLGGTAVDRLVLSGLTLCHEPRQGRVTHEIAGHLHPAARLSMYGHSVRRPCFVGNGLRLVMPAFGAYTGGLNVLDDAFQPLFGNDGMSVWMLGQDGVYPVATRHLRED